MVSSNKILTVSYGTFSCTLEGFDDSFDTMKAIAEYFRDLAQDDRYFGAEPPTPDAEMLARIAEREIARRVEARFEKGNLVLRAQDGTGSPQGDVATEPSMGAALVGAAAGAAATDLAVADTRDFDDAEEDGLDYDLRSDDADDLTLAIETDDFEDEVSDVQYDTDDLDEADDEAADDTPLMVADDPAEDMVIETPDADIAEPVIPATVAADSVADKLQRIRAVVAHKAQSQPEYIEDEHAMSGSDNDGEDENDAIDATAEIPGFPAETDDVDTDEDTETDLVSGDDNLFTDTIAAMINDQIDQDEDEEAFLPDLADDDEDEDEFAADPQSEIDALRAKIAELEAEAASAKAPTLRAVTDADAEDDEQVDDEDVAEARPAAIVARVSKVKRSDFDAAIAAGDIEEYEDDEDEDIAATPRVDTGDGKLTAEEEAELARELAELQAEIDDDEDWDFDVAEDDSSDEDEDEDTDDTDRSEQDDAEAEASIRKAVKLTSPARAMLTETPIEEDEDSVERLIDQTETEMDEPEGNRRRSAIAHLRAAVAATKADRLLGLGKKQTNEEEPYREDLADAVRPRRPKVTQARSERPAPVRPAPLKLVAEQRVDVSAGNMTPVRPRRVLRSSDPVEAQDVAMDSDDTGFAEFAEKAGAHTLPELLEAAASYMSFVEGRDQFSRPQLMTKLHQAEGAASSREERLRSFGQLLRDGKIEKTGGGRFTAADSIGFKPGTRAAG